MSDTNSPDPSEEYSLQPAPIRFTPSQAAEEVLEISADDLLEPEASPLHAADIDPRDLPRPGLVGTVFWMIGVFAVKFFGSFAAILYVSRNQLNALKDSEQLLKIIEENIGIVVAADQVVFVLAALLAAVFAFGTKLSRRIPLNAPPLRHLAMLAAILLPMLALNSFLSTLTMRGMSTEQVDNSILRELTNLASQTSLPLLLFVIAVCPAISEEIIFRGIIGRGLIARWGLAWGIAITSMLFIGIHMNLPQCVGIISISIVLHLSYLATRSFWTPVILHLVNNSIAAIVLKLSMTQQAANAAKIDMNATPLIPWPIALAGLACVVFGAVWIWQSRLVFRGEDGELLRTHFPTVERPPAHVSCHAEFLVPARWVLPAFAVSVIAFILTAVVFSREIPNV